MSRRYPAKAPPFAPSHFLVIDLEATCDRDDWPPERMEIIEIGAVLVEADALTPVAEFQAFVRPEMHPTLTPFCTALTGITQADVDAAVGYAEAVAALIAALPAANPLFCSWGGFDARMFDQESRRRDLPNPLPTHWNIARAFSGRLGLRRRFGVLGALARVGSSFTGRPHRGIDDARNIARLLPWCLGRADFPPEPPRWQRREQRRAREAEKAARGRAAHRPTPPLGDVRDACPEP